MNGQLRTINSAFDISGFNGYTKTYSTKKNNMFHIIVSDDSNFVLVRFQYPGLYTCENKTFALKEETTFDINVVSTLNMQYEKLNQDISMISDPEFAINSNYDTSISVPKKTDMTEEKLEIVFMLEDSGITYYSHDCNITINVCEHFILIDTCVDVCPQNSQFKTGSKIECECIYGAYKRNSDYSISCYSIDNIDSYEVILSDECKNKLMTENSITDENNLIIEKKIKVRENEIINQLDYIIYKKNGDTNIQLDSSVCNNMNVTLISPINKLYEGLDLNKVQLTNKKGYDIFNPNDDFFNDVCAKYSDENDADVPIKNKKRRILSRISIM